MADGQMEFRIERLNPLSCPKGETYSCELTGLPATVQLVTPYLTLFYATREHAEQAWHGIMHKISAHKFSAEDEQQGRQAVVRHGQATRHAARRINRPGPV